MYGCECVDLGQLDDAAETSDAPPIVPVGAPAAPAAADGPGVSLGTVLFVTAVVGTAIYLYVKD